MTALLRNSTSVVWLGLVGLTLVSWYLGTGHGSGELAGAVILAVAFTKARFVGAYFMELRAAPLPLRVAFEGYCVAVFALVLGMFLFA